MENYLYKKCYLMSYLSPTFLQLILEGISIITLIGKRHLESPQRPWLVWMLDVGKQIIGRGFSHLLYQGINIFIFKNSYNQDIEYFIYLFVDNTLGSIIFYIGHYLLYQLSIYYFGRESSCFQIGYYGDSPKYTIWLGQMIPYLTSQLMKQGMILLLLSEIHPLLPEIENPIFLLEYPRKQFVFTVVMVICPWILRTFQLLTFDTIFKNTSSSSNNCQKNIFWEKENISFSGERKSKQMRTLKDLNTYSHFSDDEEHSDSETKIII